MIGEKELIEAVGRVQADALRHWIDLGWVLPQRDGDGVRFEPADVARVRLICELHYELRIEEDSMSVVLSLLDQLYQARRSLRTLVSALEEQPEDVRTRIAALIEAKR
jgi:chaperone modulatory protein CbpM